MRWEDPTAKVVSRQIWRGLFARLGGGKEREQNPRFLDP